MINKVKMIKKVLLLLFVVAITASCASQKNVLYFQNAPTNVEFEYAQGEDITVTSGDMLTIVVSSKNPDLAAMFNLSKVQNGSSSGGSDDLAYTIDSNGNIDFPILGTIHIAGQTKEQIAQTIKSMLITNKLVNDPVITIDFKNLQYYVLGEVTNPGTYYIEKNQTTILEALSTAGDLTIYGQRDKVFLTRNVNSKKVTYQLDLRSQDVYNSPAFYVTQNDVIYVEPNKVRANQSTVNGNTVKSATFWMSLASFVTTLVVLFAN